MIKKIFICCVVSFLLFANFLFSQEQTSQEQKQTLSLNNVAVLKFKNSAFTGEDKFYGDSVGLSSAVAALLTFKLKEDMKLEVVDYNKVFGLVANEEKENKLDLSNITIAQGLEIAKKLSANFVVIGDITSVKVETKRKGGNWKTPFGAKKFYVNIAVNVKLVDVGNKKIMLENLYTERHEFSKAQGFLSGYVFAGFGSKYSPDAKVEDFDPKKFAENDLGVPFDRAFGKFMEELKKL